MMIKTKYSQLKALFFLALVSFSFALSANSNIVFLNQSTDIEDRYVESYGQMLGEVLDDISDACKQGATINGNFLLAVFRVCLKQDIIALKNDGIITPHEKNQLFAIINSLPADYCQNEEPPEPPVCDVAVPMIESLSGIVIGSIAGWPDTVAVEPFNSGGTADSWSIKPDSIWYYPDFLTFYPNLPNGFDFGFDAATNQWAFNFDPSVYDPRSPNYGPDRYLQIFLTLEAENCAGTSEVELCINCFE